MRPIYPVRLGESTISLDCIPTGRITKLPLLFPNRVGSRRTVDSAGLLRDKVGRVGPGDTHTFRFRLPFACRKSAGEVRNLLLTTPLEPWTGDTSRSTRYTSTVAAPACHARLAIQRDQAALRLLNRCRSSEMLANLSALDKRSLCFIRQLVEILGCVSVIGVVARTSLPEHNVFAGLFVHPDSRRRRWFHLHKPEGAS